MRAERPCRTPALWVGLLALVALVALVAFAGPAAAQPGTVLSFSKLSSPSLASLGLNLQDGDEFGDAVAWLGDLDGAGPSVAALAVSAIGDDDGGSSHTGAVYILFLNSAGSVLSYQKISATQGNFTGTLEGYDEFGSSVAWLGDLDGAGPSAGALAVGAMGDDDGGLDHGCVYVLLLNASGSVLSTQKVTSVQAGVPADVTADGEEFGGAVAGLRDLDGAGPAAGAMAVGAIGDNDGGVNRGAAFIVYLSSTGAFMSVAKISSTAGNFTATLDNNDNFAEDIADLGDLDGAGPAARSLAVTAVEDDDGGTGSGAVYLIHINAAGSVLSWSKISRTSGGFTGPVTSYDNFGAGVCALGDLDGTGPSTTAIAVSAGSDDGLGLNRGAVYVLLLNATGSVLSYQEISSTAGGSIGAQLDDDDEFGSALAAIGDIDGPGGAGQVLVPGVGYDDDGGPERGAAYLVSLVGGTPAPGPPIVTAPTAASVAENSPLTINITASDPDGPAISSLTASGVPAGATFTPGAGNTSGTLSWTPSYTQSGSYTVTFTATNTLSGSASTQITVTNVDRAPVVSAPANASGPENSLLTINVTASDPDGQAITSLTASGAPAGATFTPGGGNTSGTLSWTPGFTQSGSYTVTFTASNALSGSASTQVTISNVDRAPAVTAPASANGPENALLTVNVTASDPDGQAITSLTASGAPAGATFTPGGGNTSGTLSWTPGFTQSGSYTVTFTASNALSGSASTQVTISNVDRAPVVNAPASAGGPENALLTVNVTASDPDGQAITSLTASGAPAGATFTPGGGNTSGTLSWTPGPDESGSYTVTFTATNALSGSASTQVTISNVDRAPVVNAPASAGGAEDAPLSVSVTASDPDGEAIVSLTADGLPEGATFTPDAGNGSGTLEWTPGFSQSGSYTVTFTASNALSGSSSTQLAIGELDRAPAVTAPATWSGLEGVPLTIHVTAADPDGQSISQLTASGAPAGATFTPAGDQLSGTLEWTPSAGQAGVHTIMFSATNALTGQSSTEITVTVPSTGVGPGERALLRPLLSPSPVRSRSTLSFRTVEPGPITVELLDLSGRRVRLLMSLSDAPAAMQHVAVDGRDERGARLPSGVYLYRIHAARRLWTGRLVVTR